MPQSLMQLKKELRREASSKKAAGLSRFFKTGPGEYGAGDKFLGVMVPQTRALVKKYWRDLDLADIEKLLESEWHEERLAALFVLVAKFQKADELEKKKIFKFYLAHTRYINNWDLVDLSAPKIIGAFLEARNKDILFKLARSKNLWERRISILATFWFIKDGQSDVALRIAEILVNDPHDLIQKAVGWMLREIGRPWASLAGKAGKRCGREVEEEFLRKHAKTMPRTALRYAIEHFSPDKKLFYMSQGGKKSQ